MADVWIDYEGDAIAYDYEVSPTSNSWIILYNDMILTGTPEDENSGNWLVTIKA